MRRSAPTPLTRRAVLAAVAAASGASALPALAAENANPWPDLADEVFGKVAIKDGAGIVALEAPYRADDAAIVPITMRVNLPQGDARRLEALTLLIDRNPSPLAGIFHVGPKVALRALSTRVRVDAYTDIHAVAKLSDGGLYATKAFVKASGGCSAPMAKDPKDARAQMGEIRLRQFADVPQGERDVQMMVRHPNNSGMQMDQLTRLYIPPLFIDTWKLWQGDDLVLWMEGGISISEDPNIRLTYRLPDSGDFRVEAIDNGNHDFKANFPNRNAPA